MYIDHHVIQSFFRSLVTPRSFSLHLWINQLHILGRIKWLYCIMFLLIGYSWSSNITSVKFTSYLCIKLILPRLSLKTKMMYMYIFHIFCGSSSHFLSQKIMLWFMILLDKNYKFLSSIILVLFKTYSCT